MSIADGSHSQTGKEKIKDVSWSSGCRSWVPSHGALEGVWLGAHICSEQFCLGCTRFEHLADL